MTKKRDEPTWLTAVQLRILHAEVTRLFGGVDGLRDAALLESATASPKNRFLYEDDVSPFGLAATLANAISRNHPFLDGNKRVALLAIRGFLFLNGWSFTPDEVESVTVIEGLASGEVDVDVVAGWIERGARERG